MCIRDRCCSRGEAVTAVRRVWADADVDDVADLKLADVVIEVQRGSGRAGAGEGVGEGVGEDRAASVVLIDQKLDTVPNRGADSDKAAVHTVIAGQQKRSGEPATCSVEPVPGCPRRC